MALTGDERDCVLRAANAVDEAARHHHDAGRAHDRGDDAGVVAAHAKLARCLRSAQVALNRAVGEQSGVSAGDGAGNNAAVAVGGVPLGGGTSRGSPLLTGDIRGWLDRARIGSRQ